MAELEKIDGECSKYDIDFVKIEDNEEAADYGVEILPSLSSIKIYTLYNTLRIKKKMYTNNLK